MMNVGRAGDAFPVAGFASTRATAGIADTVAVRVAATAGVAPAEARDWGPPRAPAAPAPVVPAVPTAPAAASRTPDDVTLARLSRAVYVDNATLPAGWRAATRADLLAIGVRPTDLVSPNSAFRARVYAEGSGPDARFVVAFRGSTSDKSDWIANGRQAAGLRTDHYTAALAMGRRIALGGNAGAVTLTGHSLGGGLASAAAIASGRDAATFNASGLSRRTIADAGRIVRETGAGTVPDIRAYHVRGEVLSAVQDGGDRMMGALLGVALTRTWSGAAAGYRHVDAPEAYGTRIPLDAVRPDGVAWWGDHAIARHGLDYVLGGLGARP